VNAESIGHKPTVSRAPVLVLAVGAVLAVTLVLLGAWLAQSPAPPPVIDKPGTVTAPRDVNVILRDFAFDPNPLYLIAGETVRLHVINGGMVEHELVLGDQQVQAAWAVADANASPAAPLATLPPASVPPGTGGLRVLLASGASTTVEYTVPDGQPLQLFCHLPGHAERGMIGRVIILSR
jgi:uncharacterized cupredoxin-like copper-binding protein